MHFSSGFVLFASLALSLAADAQLKSENKTQLEPNGPSSSMPFEECFEDSVRADQNEGHLSMGPMEYSRTLIRGSHEFSFNLLKFLSNFESKDSSPGLLLSPFSVWSALIVLSMGAKGETEAEIKHVLGIDKIPKQSIGMSYQGLKFWYQLKKNASLQSSDNKKYSYAVANKIFVNKNMPLNECVKEHFLAEVEALDFSQSDEAVKRINDFVEKSTNGKIKNLLPNGGVTPWTQVVVANGIYFHSQWLYQFKASKSKDLPFHVNPSETTDVPMMTQTANFMYGVSEKLMATFLEIPYANQHFSMLLVLPENSRGVDGLIKTLRPHDLYEMIANMYDEEVFVALPKFKMEQDFDLAGPLYSMGVKKLFDPRFADLSGFFAPSASSEKNQTTKGVTVNSVVHKSFISVNEEGTEAAAATAFIMARSGRPAFPTKFIVDRPFLFLIRDKATNVILFIGVVRRPQL